MATQEFQDMLSAFLPKMRVWAMAMTRNRAAADDLVQDVAMKALSASEAFVPGTNFSAWIHRIMYNHFISGVRSRRILKNVEDAPELVISGNQEERIELGEVRIALQRLSSEQREAFRLITIDGCSYEEVAEKTGLAIGTLKSRVHRVRMQIRAHLDGRERIAA